jgi:hypothetical protein
VGPESAPGRPEGARASGEHGLAKAVGEAHGLRKHGVRYDASTATTRTRW